MLFHPPAAHEEHSEGSDDEDDSAIAVASSTLCKPASKPGPPPTLARQSNAGQEVGQGKKQRRKKNKKKKKRNAGSESFSEVSINDQSQSCDEDSALNLSRAGSTSTRPTNARNKPQAQDFTPLKEKIDDNFFDDQDSSEDEGMPDYKIGGYHPVHVGEILLDRYIII